MHVLVAGPPATPGLVPIVLVPGLGMSARYMLPLGEILARDHRVLVCELPGFGRSASARSAPQWGIEVHAERLLEWWRRADAGPALWVGNSYAGQVLIELAAADADVAAGLVLVAPTADPTASNLPHQLARLARDVLREPRSLWPIALADWRKAGLGNLLSVGRSLVRHDVVAAARQVACPAIVVGGGRDVVVPPAWAMRLAGLLRDGAVSIVSDAPHTPHYTHPREVAALVERLAARVGAGGEGRERVVIRAPA